MNYIVFDLEWNQPMDGKRSKERDLLFEIIEIGAVKCDEEGNIIDSYEQMVKPTVYHKINKYTAKMLALEEEELSKGKYFSKAVREFLRWCGEEPYAFVTWGSQDIFELRENMNYYKIPFSEGPVKYINLQRIYGILTGEEGKNKGLEAAIDELGLSKEIPFHRADADAYYTAKIFKTVNKEDILKYPSYDVYEPPRTREEEFMQEGDKEYLFCFHSLKTREEANHRPYAITMSCPKCNGRLVRKVMNWSNSSSGLSAVAKCGTHGYISIRVRTKESVQHRYYTEKLFRYIDAEEFEKIKEKKTKEKSKKES